jgi:hypothetical protein
VVLRAGGTDSAKDDSAEDVVAVDLFCSEEGFIATVCSVGFVITAPPAKIVVELFVASSSSGIASPAARTHARTGRRPG